MSRNIMFIKLWFVHPKKTWEVQIMKLFAYQFSVSSCYLISLGSYIFFSSFFLDTLREETKCHDLKNNYSSERIKARGRTQEYERSGNKLLIFS
jgi:hypothetical protein